jgi:hypothetical protein
MGPVPSRIVTYAHRPKRVPRKKAQAAVITGPAIVTATSKRTHRQFADVVASGGLATIVTAVFRRACVRPVDAAPCPLAQMGSAIQSQTILRLRKPAR